MHKNKQVATLNQFRRDVKEKINEIYSIEKSVLAIHEDNIELQDLIEAYDENFPQVCIDIVHEEVFNFKNNKIDDAY